MAAASAYCDAARYQCGVWAVNEFEAMGLSTEQYIDVYERISIIMADAGKALAAFSEAIGPISWTVTGKYATWFAWQNARSVPRQYRDTMMRRKLRKIYRVR